MRAVSSLGCLVLIHAAACSGSVAHTETAKPAAKPAAAAPVAAPAAAQPQAAPADVPAPPPAQEGAATATPPGAALPARLDGGAIPRASLLAVLSHGIGRFLQKVRAEAHLVGGRFLGWRLLALFENEPAVQVKVLQPGDTVMRVNGQSIERPEQFKNVWDSLATESELVLLVQRAGERTEVRYRIVDQ